MNKPLDPMSVEKTETPAAAYVLRRRYGRARHAITVASWVTAVSMLFQPVAVLAGTVYWDKDTTATFSWDTAANWTGTPAVKPTSSDTAYFRHPLATSGNSTILTLDGNQSVLGLVFGMHVYNGYWNAVTINTGTSGELTIGAGGIWVDAQNGANAYPGTVTINANVVLGTSQTWSQYSNNPLIVNGAVTGSGGAYTLTVAGRGNTTIAGVISDTDGSNKTSLTMLGNAGSGSTLTLTGANTYTGNSTLTAGTLKLDFTQTGSPTAGTGIISSSSPLVLNGGTLQIVGDASADTQTFASTALNGGAAVTASTMNNASAYVDFGTITRTAPGTINFIRPAAGSIKVSNANDNSGIIGPWATVAGSDWAANDGSGNVVAYTGYTDANAQSGWSNASADTNYRANTGVQSLTDNRFANTLKFTTTGGTLALGNYNLSVNGILSAVNTITLTSTGGKLGAAASSEIVLAGPNNFQLNNALFADGTTTITKAGTGTLTANVASAFGAKTVNVTAGTLTSAAANYISGATVNVYALGTLSGNSAANSLNGSTINLYPGGTISALATTSGNNATLNLMSGTVYCPPADSAGFSNGTIRVNAGAILTPIDPADWGQWSPTTRTLTDATIVLNGGDLNVQRGGLAYNSPPLNLGGNIQVLDNSTITGGESNRDGFLDQNNNLVVPNAFRFQSLDFTGVNKTLTIQRGAGNPPSASRITFDNVTLSNSGTLYVPKSANDRDNVYFSAMGAGSASAVLTKTGPGPLTISGASSATGAIKVSAGTLALNASMASGTVVLDGGTNTSSAAGNTVKGFVYNSGTLSSTITIGAGGFIGGTGSIDSTTYGRLTQTAGASLGTGSGVSPGDPTATNTVGTLQTGTGVSFAFQNGGVFSLDIRDATTISNGTSHDYFDVTNGNLSIGTTPSMQVALYNGVTNNDLIGKTFTFAHYSGTRSGAAATAWYVIPAGGSTVNWVGGTGLDWGTAANWSPSSGVDGTVTYDDTNKKLNVTFATADKPSAASDVTISTDSPAVTGPGSSKAIKSLVLGDGTTTPSLTLQAGNLTVGTTVEIKSSSSVGLTTTSGAGGLITPLLTLSGGTARATLGSAANNVATANVTAGTLTVNGGTVSVVNLSGNGSLAGTQAVPQVNVTGGTPTFSGNATIMTVTGGTLTATGGTIGTANFNATAGTVNASSSVNITTTLAQKDGGAISGAFGISGSDIGNPAVTRTVTLGASAVTMRMAPVAPGNMTGWWKFDEPTGNGNTTAANSGTGGATLNATKTGTQTGVAGKFGNATYGKDTTGGGTADNLWGVSGLPSGTFTSDFTLSAWVKWDGPSGNNYNRLFGNTGTGSFQLYRDSGSGYFGGFGPALTPTTFDSNWNLFTWSVTRIVNNETITVYKNGSQIASGNQGGAFANVTALNIGGNPDCSWNGTIDDFRLYNKALSATEVAAMYNNGNGDLATADYSNTAVTFVSGSTLRLDTGTTAKLGNLTCTGSATLSGNSVGGGLTPSALQAGTLTIGINGANYGKLNLGTMPLTLNGTPKLAVTSTSPTEPAYCVAVAAAGSFSTLHGSQVTDNNQKWNVEVRDSGGTTVNKEGPELWLVAASGGTAILFK